MPKSAIKRFIYNQYRSSLIFRDSYKKYVARSTKNPLRRYLENQLWQLRNGEFCDFYYAWGLNDKTCRMIDFISRREFLKFKIQAEKHLKSINQMSEFNYDILTKDKFVSGSLIQSNSIACIPHIGLLVRGEYLPLSEGANSLIELFDREDELYIKRVTLEASEGVVCCNASKNKLLANDNQYSYDALMNILSKGVWIVQRKIKSHSAIRLVNASALNTTRIVTVIDKDTPKYLTGFQAFATGKANTDSWDKGAIYVGIDLDRECLKEFGFHNLSDPKNNVSLKHPDSGVIFKGYHIPYLQKGVNLCIQAHRLFYNNFIIGWDVAITENGPLIVEANEKPGMNAVQCVDGGIRSQILEYYHRLIEK